MTDYVDIDFDRVITETDKATLFEIEEREVWIPNSCIEGFFNDDGGTAAVAEWFALKEGLI